MNILVISHKHQDGYPTASYIHHQIMTFASLGHNVRVIVPVALGKKSLTGKRFGAMCESCEYDGILHTFIRYVSVSKYGNYGFNANSAIHSIKFFYGRLFDGFIPDVIHAHTIGFDSMIGSFLKSQIGCPLVVTTHGSDTEVPLSEGKGWFVKKCCDEADVVICVGSKLKKRLMECRVASDLVVIPNGFMLNNLPKDFNKIRNSIIQVCNLIPLKRVDVTIRAFARIKETCPTAKLTIVGSGPEKDNLISLCKEFGVYDSVEFTGQISNLKVMEKLAETEFFIMVSSPEGFGIVYLEAMAAKCFTIGAENEGISDVIVSGKNGCLLPVDDVEAIVKKVQWAMKNRKEMEMIANNGHKTALEYDWRNNSKRVIAIFESLIGIKHDG